MRQRDGGAVVAVWCNTGDSGAGAGAGRAPKRRLRIRKKPQPPKLSKNADAGYGGIGPRQLPSAGLGTFDTPTSIAIDAAAGKVYIADPTRGVVLVFDQKKGRCIYELNHPALIQPTSVVATAGRVFVADFKRHYIHVFDSAPCSRV